MVGSGRRENYYYKVFTLHGILINYGEQERQGGKASRRAATTRREPAFLKTGGNPWKKKTKKMKRIKKNKKKKQKGTSVFLGKRRLNACLASFGVWGWNRMVEPESARPTFFTRRPFFCWTSNKMGATTTKTRAAGMCVAGGLFFYFLFYSSF